MKILSILKKAIVIISLVFAIVGTLTFLMTYANIGFVENFVSQWMSSLLLAATVMAPIGYVLITLIERLINRVFANQTQTIRSLITGVLMSVIMGSVMAAISTYNNLSFNDVTSFISNWSVAFLTAIPVGLSMSVIMTLFVKPKFDDYIAS